MVTNVVTISKNGLVSQNYKTEILFVIPEVLPISIYTAIFVILFFFFFYFIYLIYLFKLCTVHVVTFTLLKDQLMHLFQHFYIHIKTPEILLKNVP
jgi:hypothetical protein